MRAVVGAGTMSEGSRFSGVEANNRRASPILHKRFFPQARRATAITGLEQWAGLIPTTSSVARGFRT